VSDRGDGNLVGSADPQPAIRLHRCQTINALVYQSIIN
jgi:hypothetical protein